MTLSTDLRAFGDRAITPAEGVLECGHRVFDKLIRKIVEKSKTPIVRVAKNGSVGKKTAICIKVDFDCMFFLDPLVLPIERHDEFLNDVQDIITLNFSCDHIYVSSSAVTCFMEGFYFDFLPAPFAVEGGQCVEGQLIYRIKHPMSTEGMDPYGGRCLGDQALAEGAVIFFKEQSAFVHCLARLLKWWSASILVPGFFNGRSFRMEMFAVLAAKEEKNDDILRGLRIALDKIRNYRKVYAIFERFYSKSDLPPVMAEQRPLLLDPANPRNNLLSSDVHQYFDELAGFAGETLLRLDVSERSGRLLQHVFAPQPSIWSFLDQQPHQDSWIVGSKVLTSEKQPRVLAQRSHVKVKVLEVVAHMIGSAVYGKSGLATRDDVVKIIDCVLYGSRRTWSPSSERFEDKDAVAIFPIHDEAGTCVLAGFNVERN